MQIGMLLSIKVLRNSDSRSTSLPCVAWVLQSILAGSDSLFRVSLSTSCYFYARQSKPSLLLSPLALLPVLASLFQPPATSRCVKTGLRFCLIHYLCCEFWLLYFNLLLPLVASEQACVCMRVCVCVCVSVSVWVCVHALSGPTGPRACGTALGQRHVEERVRASLGFVCSHTMPAHET